MGALRRLTTVPTGDGPGPGGAAGGDDNRISAFVTAASLATFPVASMVVTLFWKLAATAFSWGDERWVAALLALIVGFFIYLIGREKNVGADKQAINIFIGVVNSGFLAAAALGLDVAGGNLVTE